MDKKLIKELKTFTPHPGQILIIRIDVENRPPSVAQKILQNYREQFEKYFTGTDIKILVVPHTVDFAVLDEKDAFFGVLTN